MASVDPSAFGELEFPVGACSECGREVLAYVAYGNPGGAVFCCVHCDTPLRATPRAASGAALPEIGYGLLEAQGCGSGGCGSGQCGRATRREAASEPDDPS